MCLRQMFLIQNPIVKKGYFRQLYHLPVPKKLERPAFLAFNQIYKVQHPNLVKLLK